MKKLIKTFALMIFFSFALTGFAFADVAPMGPIIAVSLCLLVAAIAVVVVAVVLIVKLIMHIAKNRK